MKKIFLSFLSNPVLATLVFVLILAGGAMALASMHRELLPDFSLDEILIEAEYPGASPTEVQDGIIRKIEEALKGMEGVADYITRSEENHGSAEVAVRYGYDSTTVLNRIRSRIEAISTFPSGAEKPVITEQLNRTEVLRLYVAAQLPEQQHKELARSIQDDLRALPGVTQVELVGVRDYEINVEISEERLRSFNLHFQDVAERIASESFDLFGGSIRTADRTIRIRTLGSRCTAEDLATLPLLTQKNGAVVTLDRVADIKDGFTDDTSSVAVNGRRAVVFVLNKTRTEDALEISETVKEYVRQKRLQLPNTLDFNILYDSTEDLRSRIALMAINGLGGLCLVMLLLWLFLDSRLGFWVGMGIPVSVLGTLAVICSLGGTINMLSLFGLIIILGIVADDAIVVGENIFLHVQRGLSPPAAALKGVQEVGPPVFAAVLTTVLAFVPLAFLNDTIGKFLRILPLVVIPCLLISLLESLLLLPAHLAHGLKLKKQKKQDKRNSPPLMKRLRRMRNRIKKMPTLFADKHYPPLIERVLKFRYVWLSGGLCVLLLCMGLFPAGFVTIEALPDTGGRLLISSITMPSGTSERLTRQAVSQVEQGLLQLTSNLGTAAEGFNLKRMSVVGATLSEDSETGSNLGGVQVILDSDLHADLTSLDFLERWEEAVGPVNGAESVVFESVVEGPPGEPIEIWLRGRDYTVLKKAAREMTEALQAVPGVRRIRSDLSSQVDELRCTLKPEAAHLGITQTELARQIRAAFYGVESVRLQRSRDDVRVKVRYTGKERASLATLDSLRIRTPDGANIPLYSVAELSLSKGASVIRRVNGMRCLTVTAGVDESATNADEIIAYLSKGVAEDMKKRFPGLDVSFEGDERQMEEALSGLTIGYPLALLGIFFVVATIFRSYAQPLLILCIIPFGISGAVVAHLVAGVNISLMTLFGMAALSGIVVNDAIVFIERINKNLLAGAEIFQAIKDAGRHRFRAILLTTISTVGGLTPLLLENNLSAQFLKPMALAISAGLVVSTVATLVLIPCLFAALSDLRLFYHRFRTGETASREMLEPYPARFNKALEEAL